MNRICNTCNIEIDENNYLKDRTVCKSCYNKNRRKNNLIQNQQPKRDDKKKRKVDNSVSNIGKPKTDNVNVPGKQTLNINSNVLTYENHRHVIIGPSNVGKTYNMLKVLEKIGNKRPVHIITRYPNQYPIYKTTSDINPIKKYKESFVIFDNMSRARNSSQIDELFTRGRHEDLDVYYVKQSYFGLPRQSIRNNNDRLILFRQTLRDVRIMYYDIGAYDMKYDEYKEMCYFAWSEKFNYLCIDMGKKNEGNYRVFNESKTTYFDCIPESEPFQKPMIVIHTSTLICINIKQAIHNLLI